MRVFSFLLTSLFRISTEVLNNYAYLSFIEGLLSIALTDLEPDNFFLSANSLSFEDNKALLLAALDLEITFVSLCVLANSLSSLSSNSVLEGHFSLLC